MLTVAKEKIKPIISVTVDDEEQIRSTLKNFKEPFIFLEKKDKLFAYAALNNQLLEKLEIQKFSIESLLEHAKSLESICHLSQQISLPILFQIIGEPFAIVRGEDGIPTGYIRREDVLAELFKQENKSVDLLKILLTSIPMGIFVLDKERQIINCNESGLNMIKSTAEKVLNVPGENILASSILTMCLKREKPF